MCGPKPDPAAAVQQVNCVLPVPPSDPSALMAQLNLDPALCHLESNGLTCVKDASSSQPAKRGLDFSFVPVDLEVAVSDVSVERRGVDKLAVLPVPKDVLKGSVVGVGGVGGGLKGGAVDADAYVFHVEWKPSQGLDVMNPAVNVGRVGVVGKVGNVGAVHA